MARKKIDGVIEAVRYTHSGLIGLVRTYQRRGAVWSDRILLNRSELAQQLKNGKHFLTGVRKEYLGGVFETGAVVHFAGEHIVAGDGTAPQDRLAGVSQF